MHAKQFTLVKQDGGAIFPRCRRKNGKIFQVFRVGESSTWLPKTERTFDSVIISIFLLFQNVLICM